MTEQKHKAGDWLQSLSSAERKEVAVSRGLFAYFPDALALVARHSVRSNEKHNPGEPVHWARGKSDDHEDCIGRHSIAVAVDPDSLDGKEPHMICRAWRALAALQLWAERQRQEGVGEWIQWSGGSCPVPPKTLVRCRLRDGSKGIGRAETWFWEWDTEKSPGDIIAYKVEPE